MCPTFYTFTLVQILKPEQNTAAIILCFPNAMQLSEQFQGRLEEECLREGRGREGEREREKEERLKESEASDASALLWPSACMCKLLG